MSEFERARRSSRSEMSRRRFILLTTGSFSLVAAALSNTPNIKSPFHLLEKAGFAVDSADYGDTYLEEVKRRVIPRFAVDLGRLAGKELTIVDPNEEMDELAVKLSTLPHSFSLEQMGRVARRRALFVAYGLGINAFSFQDKSYDSFSPLQNSMLTEHFEELVTVASLPQTTSLSVAPILDDVGNRLAVIELSSLPDSGALSSESASSLTFPPDRSLLELE